MYRLAVALGDLQRAELHASSIQALASAMGIELVCATDVQGLEERLEELAPIDILIVDTVSSPADTGEGGIDFVARRFPAGCPTQVVYLTSHLEHVSAVYRTQHAYFLNYPAAPEDMNEALQAACQVLHACGNRPFCVRLEGKIQVVYPQRILYIESDRRKLHIHMGSEVLTTYATLDAISRNLPDSFVRCHKSFLVNMRCIESMDAHRITLFTGEAVPVSQKRRKPTHDAFVAYMDAVL